jgi:hypothetical protein
MPIVYRFANKLERFHTVISVIHSFPIFPPSGFFGRSSFPVVPATLPPSVVSVSEYTQSGNGRFLAYSHDGKISSGC